MKSNKRLEAEIERVACLWNVSSVTVGDQDSNYCSAVYHSLLWARGRRESLPSEIVERYLVKHGKLAPRPQ